MYYLANEDYSELVKEAEIYTKSLLFVFVKNSTSIRDTIIRNFIARGMTTLLSIEELWKDEHYQDCWILNRALLDRFFHLVELDKENSFGTFDEWSFVKQYEARNKALSDPELKGRLDLSEWKITDVQKERYRSLKTKNVHWSRPRSEDVARGAELEFLYKYGYDYGSTHVHPMSNDGQEDFLRLTGIQEEGFVPSDRKIILSNSILVLMLLIQQGLNASSLKWRGVVYDFLTNVLGMLGERRLGYKESLAKICLMQVSNIALCEKS